MSSKAPEGSKQVLPIYYLEYSYIILNNGNNIGNSLELLDLEFKPSNNLISLLGKDTFSGNLINGFSGPGSLNENAEGEFKLMFGLKPELLNKINAESVESLMLDGKLILKEGNTKVAEFKLD